MKRKSIVVLAVVLLFFGAFGTVEAEIVGLSWHTQLDTIAGMEQELPEGVGNGDTISGMFLYETDWGWYSGSTHDDSSRNYHTFLWSMQLGENSYGRYYYDGLGNLGIGSLHIKNNHPEYYDMVSFGISVTYTNPVNEYYFRLWLQDYDATTLATGDEPTVFNFDDFEVTRLEILKIKSWQIVTIAEYDNLSDFNLTVIPEPATVLLLGLGGIILRKKR